MKMTAPNLKSGPSLRKLEADLEVNKTTLHNWKQNRPKLFEFIIESYEHKAALKENLMFLIDQKQKMENRIEEESKNIKD
jgi:hypothetical protein